MKQKLKKKKNWKRKTKERIIRKNISNLFRRKTLRRSALGQAFSVTYTVECRLWTYRISDYEGASPRVLRSLQDFRYAMNVHLLFAGCSFFPRPCSNTRNNLLAFFSFFIPFPRKKRRLGSAAKTWWTRESFVQTPLSSSFVFRRCPCVAAARLEC
jgi:hypothetical protein